MKKFITLFIATLFFAMADAQPIASNAHLRMGINVTISSGRYQNSNFAADRRLREDIFRINNKFDRKIYQVQHNFFISYWQKSRRIQALEQQRQRELNKLYIKYSQRERKHGHNNRRY